MTSIPLSNPLDTMEIGWIKLKATSLSPEAQGFIRQLERALHTVHLEPLKKSASLRKSNRLYAGCLVFPDLALRTLFLIIPRILVDKPIGEGNKNGYDGRNTQKVDKPAIWQYF